MATIDDWNDKYGSKTRPKPKPTGIDSWRRTPTPTPTVRTTTNRTAGTGSRSGGGGVAGGVKRPALFDSAGDPGKPIRDRIGTAGAPATDLNPFSGIQSFFKPAADWLDWYGKTRTKNVGKFWETGGGLWGKQDNSVVGGGKAVAKPGMTDLEREHLGRIGQPEFDLTGGQDDSGIMAGMTIAEALEQIKGLMGEMGMNERVSYDPLRAQARSQWADADARTLAMYQQLQGKIGENAAGLGQLYDQGVADTNASTQFANTQNQQAAQGVNDMKSQQAAALGIQEAVANQIGAGDLAGRDTVARAADTTARGQLASNQLIGNKVSALDFNSDLVGAAGLQGQMARLQRQNELSRLLAGYDVQEQEANARSQSSNQQQALDYAFKLLGVNRDDIAEENDSIYRATTAENTNWYNQQRIAQASGTTGGKARGLALRDPAFQAAMDDFGVTPEQWDKMNAQQRQPILKQMNQYL